MALLDELDRVQQMPLDLLESFGAAVDLENPTREDALPAFASVNLIPEPYAEPGDISDAVLFLASDEARFITGAVLSPSMGLSASNI